MDNLQSGISYRPIWSDEDTFEELDEELAESIRRFNAEDDAVLKKQIQEKDDIIKQKDSIILEKESAIAAIDKENIRLTMIIISFLKSEGKTQEEVSRFSNIPLETVKEYWD